MLCYIVLSFEVQVFVLHRFSVKVSLLFFGFALFFVLLLSFSHLPLFVLCEIIYFLFYRDFDKILN